MKCFQTFCLIIFTLVYCVFSLENQSMLMTCNADDLPCLNVSTKLFLNATAGGYPALGFLAIDPIVIPELELRPDDKDVDLIYTVKNIVLTGLKDEDVTGFKFDRKTYNAVLQVVAPHLEIEGNMKIALASNSSCSVTGKYTGKGGVKLTVSYHCPVEKFPDGSEHFVVGPETTECEIVGEPSYELDDKMVQELVQVKELEKERAKLQNSARINILQEAMCKLAKKAYVSVIHNTRTAAKLLPKDDFIKDI